MKIKWFMGSTVMLPLPWARAIGARAQGDVFAICEGPKSELVAMLDRRGGPHFDSAAWLVRDMRLVRDGFIGNSWQAVLDSGAIDPDRPGIYVAENLVRGSRVIEVCPDGSLELVAVMEYESKFGGRGLYALKVDPRQAVSA